MDDEQRRREKLYDKFRAGVLLGNAPGDYVDVDDLIDIYDYANDCNDEYVQLMAIIYAMNHYPDDEYMLQRRAYFLTQNLGMADAAPGLMQGHVHESALWDMLSLLNRRPDASEAAAEMDRIVRHFSDFDDETLIEMVNTCCELDIFPWLCDNRALVQKRSQYPDTLLYEMAQEASDRGDHHLSAMLLDELTAMEPFNVGYWQMLSQEWVLCDDFENALSAIDYALALDGKSMPLRLARAQILFDMRRDRPDCIATVEKLVERKPDYQEGVNSLTAMYAIEGQRDKARDTLAAYLKRNATDRTALSQGFMLADSAFNLENLARYYNAVRMDDDEDVRTWAETERKNGDVVASADILWAYGQHSGRYPAIGLLIDSLYVDKRYKQVLVVFNDHSAEFTGKEMFLVGLSLLRLGSPDQAMQVFDALLSVDNVVGMQPVEKLLAAGVRSVIEGIKKMVEDDSLTTDALDRLDPFVMPAPVATDEAS